jgi:hypothetical protein
LSSCCIFGQIVIDLKRVIFYPFRKGNPAQESKHTLISAVKDLFVKVVISGI